MLRAKHTQGLPGLLGTSHADLPVRVRRGPQLQDTRSIRHYDLQV